MNTHKCPISTCSRQVPNNQLMCFDHWKQVPKELQTRLYSAYRAKMNGKGTAEGHQAAMDACIESVEGSE